MTILFWASLSFFLLVLVAGAGAVGYVALSGWRTVRAVRRGALAELTALSERVGALERRAETLGARAEELEASVARLRRSLAYARVLLLAIGDVRGALAAVRAFVPAK